MTTYLHVDHVNINPYFFIFVVERIKKSIWPSSGFTECLDKGIMPRSN